jgi:hypothetical protein
VQSFDAVKTRPLAFVAVVDSLRTSGLLFLLLAVGLGALVLAVFDWQLREVLYGTALGVLVWGAFAGFEVRKEVPSSESLPLAPAGAKLERSFSLRRVVLVLPLFVALAWFADRVDLGAVFVPGQLAGSAVAKLVGAFLVRRWERAHRTRVLLRWSDSGEPELYATTPRPTFVAQAVAFDRDADPDPEYLVLFEDRNGIGRRFEVQRTLDTYCVVTELGQTDDGGVLEWWIEGTTLVIALDESAAEALGAPEFWIVLPKPERAAVEAALRALLT